jgi:hypothetical protein
MRVGASPIGWRWILCLAGSVHRREVLVGRLACRVTWADCGGLWIPCGSMPIGAPCSISASTPTSCGASHPEPAEAQATTPPQDPRQPADPESTLMRAGTEPTMPPQDPHWLADPESTLLRAGMERATPPQDPHGLADPESNVDARRHRGLDQPVVATPLTCTITYAGSPTP